ncbi:hypothetical protein D1BOALGB6SA_7494 [Olavius sp. associated proteobacterium Delta 1]|nr:hypothetical protein D1BOALGB6SA_7494 [Olavius sp. associated proteobacterium Delta 1]
MELTLGHQLRPATVIEVDGLFSCRKFPFQKLVKKLICFYKKHICILIARKNF